MHRRPASAVVRSLASQWPKVPLTVGELATPDRRPEHARDHLLPDDRERGTRSSHAAPRRGRAIKKAEGSACSARPGATSAGRRSVLRRRVRVSLRNLSKMKRQYATAQGRRRRDLSDSVRVYQAKLDAGS